MSDKKHPQGGYMRSLHKLEEKLYSPELKLSGLSELKVLLYIRHNSIRWDKEDYEFSYSEIAQGVGISERFVKTVIKTLVKKKLLLIYKSSLNGKHSKNVMGLNPAYWGELIEETSRPKFSVIEGGKQEKLSTGVIHTSPRVVIHTSPQGCSIDHPEHPQEPLPERRSEDLKNSSKEQIKKLLGGIGESFTLSGKKRSQEEHEEIVRKQIADMKAGRI